MESRPNNTDRTHNVSWIWGGVLIALGIVFMMSQFFPRSFGFLVPIIICGGIGMTFFAVYLSSNEHWWALIPAYMMWAIGGLILVGETFDKLLGFLIPFAFGFPFLYVYHRNRDQWWALIPGYIFVALGVVIGSGIFLGDWTLGVLIPTAFGLPFLYVYLRNRKHLWALITAGLAATVSLVFLLDAAVRFIPVVMIVGGIYLLVRQYGGGKSGSAKKKETGSTRPEPEFTPIMPQTGPEADKPPVEDFVPLGQNRKN